MVFRVSFISFTLMSSSISFPILYAGSLYLQAGLSKLIHGGIEWVSSGRTVLQYSYFLGTDFGKNLLAIDYMPELISFTSIGVELLVFFFIFSTKFYKYIGLILIGFHLGIFLTMNITFWHLIHLYPALFLSLSKSSKKGINILNKV